MINYQPEELAVRLRSEGEAVQAYFNGLTPEQWNRELYASGANWKVRDVLAHFIAAERGFHELIQNVMNGGPGAGSEINIDDYNAHTVGEMAGLDPQVMLAQFAMVRERTAALVDALSPEQLKQRGRHPNLGESALDEMVRAIYHHNSLHLRDIRQVLKTPGSGAMNNRGGAMDNRGGAPQSGGTA